MEGDGGDWPQRQLSPQCHKSTVVWVDWMQWSVGLGRSVLGENFSEPEHLSVPGDDGVGWQTA